MKKLVAIILIVVISLVSLVVSIEFNSYNKNYYINSYIENQIPKITNKSINDLSKITDNIISYLKNKGGNELLEPYFNEREVLHMEDVQGLFKIARWIRTIGIILSLLLISYLLRKKAYGFLGRILSLGLFTNHLIFGVLAILASIDFNRYFNYFHYIFFSNDLWILNPKTDLMIQMLPEVFFMKIALNIMLSFFILLAIIQVVGYWLIRKGRGRYGRYRRKNKGIFYRKK